MAIGLALLIIVGVYQVGTRVNNKRLAKKHGYSHLDHDALWRPLDGKNGKRLTKNEARALANYRKEVSSSSMNPYGVEHQFGETSIVEEDLPDYTQVKQEIKKEKKSQNKFHQLKKKKDGGLLAFNLNNNNYDPIHQQQQQNNNLASSSIPTYEQSGSVTTSSRAI